LIVTKLALSHCEGKLSELFLERESMFPTDVVIVAGARTPMARYTGAFSEVSAIELAAHASREAIRRSGVDAGEFDHAIFGNVMQTSADALYGARHVGL
jgi:acetyl-CoA acetyltransferase